MAAGTKPEAVPQRATWKPPTGTSGFWQKLEVPVKSAPGGGEGVWRAFQFFVPPDARCLCYATEKNL